MKATTFQPGDRILFETGDSWTGQLWPQGSGISGSPITVGEYGWWSLAYNSSGYLTITGVASGKALDVNAASTWPGTTMQLWTINGGANQQWLIAPAGNGSYTIESRATATASMYKAQTTDGAPIDARRARRHRTLPAGPNAE